jgi:Ala-tRNA(Pro) deacylase
MTKTPDDLFALLDKLGIRTETIRHPPLFTVAESKALRGQLAGGHTKNLFLKDRKDNFFLVSVEEDADVDLKTIHQAIGAASRVSFGNPERMMALLGVTPGAVTLFGAINDVEGKVRIFVDEALMAQRSINAHPLTNEATTAIAPQDLLLFLKATGHEPAILKIGR